MQENKQATQAKLSLEVNVNTNTVIAKLGAHIVGELKYELVKIDYSTPSTAEIAAKVKRIDIHEKLLFNLYPNKKNITSLLIQKFKFHFEAENIPLKIPHRSQYSHDDGDCFITEEQYRLLIFIFNIGISDKSNFEPSESNHDSIADSETDKTLQKSKKEFKPFTALVKNDASSQHKIFEATQNPKITSQTKLYGRLSSSLLFLFGLLIVIDQVDCNKCYGIIMISLSLLPPTGLLGFEYTHENKPNFFSRRCRKQKNEASQATASEEIRYINPN